MARLIWSPRAADNFEGILLYVEQFSPSAAAKIARGIMALVERIPSEPLLGAVVPELQQHDLRERLFMRKYRIIYRVHDDAVEIVCIAHGARLLENVLGDEFFADDEEE